MAIDYSFPPYLEKAKVFSDRNRARIVKLLKEKGEMTNTNLAAELGISKATVTHHMKILKEAGVVKVMRIEESRGIPKKYYGLDRKFSMVGKGSFAEPLSREVERNFRKLVHREKLRKELGDNININFLRLYRSALLSADVNFDSELYEQGFHLGKEVLSEMVESGDTLEKVMESLGRLWEGLNLGRMEVEEVGDVTRVMINDCYQCMEMPDLGRPLCASDEGIIAGVLEKKLGLPFRVREVECWGTGEEHCKFEIEEKTS